MTRKSLFFYCALSFLLAVLLNSKAQANCQPYYGKSYAVTLNIGTITVSNEDSVGTVLKRVTVDNGPVDQNPYWMYCASGQAQLLYEVSNTTPSTYSNRVYDTGITGIGIRFTFSSNEISSYTLQGQSSWQQISPMTFYYDPGQYVAEVIKTASQSGAGSVTKAIHIRQSTDRGNTLGTLDLIGGKIISSGCSIVNRVLNINLGSHPASEFSGAGSATEKVGVPVELSCPSAGTVVNLSVSATAMNAAEGVIKLNSGSTATGIGVQLLRPDGLPLSLDSTIRLGKSTFGDNIFTLFARYRQQGNSVTSGTADAQATLTMSYQ